jgi:hypothetical protein
MPDDTNAFAFSLYYKNTDIRQAEQDIRRESTKVYGLLDQKMKNRNVQVARESSMARLGHLALERVELCQIDGYASGARAASASGLRDLHFVADIL